MSDGNSEPEKPVVKPDDPVVKPDDPVAKNDERRDFSIPPNPSVQAPSFLGGVASVLMFIVGLFLLLVPGGCAVSWLVMAVSALFHPSNGGASMAGSAIFFILLNAALAYAGYSMIRSALKG